MKRNWFIVAMCVALILVFVGCQPQVVTVYQAIHEIGTGLEVVDNSDNYDLDARFKYFQMFQLGGDCTLHLQATTGIVSYYFVATENSDGSASCELKGIYVYEVGDIAFGEIRGDRLAEYVDKLNFTLVLENNVVTSHDLPQLIVE